MLANSVSNRDNAAAYQLGRLRLPGLPIDNVCNQYLHGIKELSSQVTLQPGLPAAHGDYSDVYIGTLFHENGSATSKVAVKVFRVTQKRNIERALKALKRLTREVLMFNRVDHPRIAEFYGWAVIDKHVALVMKWYDQGTASDYLHAKDSRHRLQIVKDLAEGLEYLHSKNIVHGDLKGNNVLITDSGRAVITDLGLSRILDIRTGITTSSFSGSVRWQSPELVIPWVSILSPHHPIPNTVASDVWAFACTAFELLLGTVPYSDLTKPTSIANEIVNNVPPFKLNLSELEDHLDRIRVVLETCLRREPAERPTMGSIVQKLSSF